MTQENQNFITEYLRHRSEYTAYCLAFNPQNAADFESIMRAAGRLMDDPEVGGLINSVLSSVRHEVEQQVRAELKTDLLTVQSKRELLARIARGEAYAVQSYKGKDCNVCTQHVWPTINQMLRAIDLDNRMAGHYPVTQSAGGSQQLTKTQNTPEAQQNTTTVDASLVPPFREDRRVSREGHNAQDVTTAERNSENTPIPQQNTTTVVTSLVPPFREDRRVSREGHNAQDVTTAERNSQNTLNPTTKHNNLRSLNPANKNY